MTDEGKTITLVCSYCITTRMFARITWFKDGKPVISNAKQVVSGNKLTIAYTKYGRDDGLYACVVTGAKGHVNGTRLMTVIIEKRKINNMCHNDSSFINQGRVFLIRYEPLTGH